MAFSTLTAIAIVLYTLYERTNTTSIDIIKDEYAEAVFFMGLKVRRSEGLNHYYPIFEMVPNKNNELALERRSRSIERSLKKRVDLNKNCNDEIRVKIKRITRLSIIIEVWQTLVKETAYMLPYVLR